VRELTALIDTYVSFALRQPAYFRDQGRHARRGAAPSGRGSGLRGRWGNSGRAGRGP
jgi:hypothetical protein